MNGSGCCAEAAQLEPSSIAIQLSDDGCVQAEFVRNLRRLRGVLWRKLSVGSGPLRLRVHFRSFWWAFSALSNLSNLCQPRPAFLRDVSQYCGAYSLPGQSCPQRRFPRFKRLFHRPQVSGDGFCLRAGHASTTMQLVSYLFQALASRLIPLPALLPVVATPVQARFAAPAVSASCKAALGALVLGRVTVLRATGVPAPLRLTIPHEERNHRQCEQGPFAHRHRGGWRTRRTLRRTS